MSLPICLLVLFLSSFTRALDPLSTKKQDSEKLPPCSACQNLVGSFEAGMARTTRGGLEGGDTAWEEKVQKSGYGSSEVRFVEIQEKLCSELPRGSSQCHENHALWEEHLEAWWKSEPRTKELKEFLCIDKLQLCCQPEHFGPKCEPCAHIGLNQKICSGNGKCKGSGTRKGNGKCLCDVGYEGSTCSSCSSNYYESYKDENKVLCSPCHKGCKDICSGPGPKSCLACKSGYIMDTEHGCSDLDECTVSKPCPKSKFCVNTEGSFRCMSCDKSCKDCESDGPDSCISCNQGYTMNKDKVCVSEESLDEGLIDNDSGNEKTNSEL